MIDALYFSGMELYHSMNSIWERNYENEKDGIYID